MATGDETIVLTSENDRRNVSERHSVWQKTITATHDADDTGDTTLTESINGILQKIVFVVPNYTNGITGQLVIKDNGGYTIFDSGEKAKDTIYTYSVSEPFFGNCSIVMGVSGAAGGSGGSMIAVLRGV